ncbi:MAG: Gldg family protein [Opitutales bacterium]
MTRAQTLLAAVAVLAAAFFANIIAARIAGRADLTEDGTFSLTAGSRRIAASVGEPVTLELYASRGDTRLSPYLEAYARRAEGLLQAFADASGGAIRLKVTDPQPDTEDESRAQRAGLGGTRAANGTAYLGVSAQQADSLRAIAFLDPRRERFLEYDLAQLIASVTRLSKPRLAFVSTLPLSTDIPQGQEPGPGDILLSELSRSFEVITVSNTATELPKDIAVVALIHPHHLNPRLAFAVDQFLLGGGPVLAAIDPLSRYQKFQQGNMPLMMVPAAAMGAASDPALLRGWGVESPVDVVVGDAAHSLQMPSSRGEPVSYPLAVVLEGDGLAGDHPATSNLRALNVLEPGSVRLAADAQPGLSFRSLATFRGPGVGSVPVAAANAGPFEKTTLQFRADGQERVFAALVSGNFRSAFPEGAPKDADGKPVASPALKVSAKPSRLLVIADSDFMLDYYSLRRGTAYGQQVYEPINDNQAFLIGALETLAGSDDLVAIRAKGAALRPFDRVNDLQRRAQARYQAEIDRQEQRLSELAEKIAELTRTSGGDLSKGIVLTPELEREVQKFTEEQATVRRALRDIRRAAREEVDSLGRGLAWVNLLAAPALLGIAGLLYAVLRRRRAA